MNEDFEERVRKAKAKKDRLVSTRAEKMAHLKAAQDKLKQLKDKANEKGYTLKELPTIIKDKEEELDKSLSDYEESLDGAETKLSKYNV